MGLPRNHTNSKVYFEEEFKVCFDTSNLDGIGHRVLDINGGQEHVPMVWYYVIKKCNKEESSNCKSDKEINEFMNHVGMDLE